MWWVTSRLLGANSRLYTLFEEIKCELHTGAQSAVFDCLAVVFRPDLVSRKIV